jgi:hypothetical protein
LPESHVPDCAGFSFTFKGLWQSIVGDVAAGATPKVGERTSKVVHDLTEIA